MVRQRFGHAALLLVVTLLLAGALTVGGAGQEQADASSAWTDTGNLSFPRKAHNATVLGGHPCGEGVAGQPAEMPGWCGKVLIYGGAVNCTLGDEQTCAGETELYNPRDPSAGTWQATGSMIRAFQDFSGVGLADGRVLAVGNEGAQLYDPAATDPATGVPGTWSAAPPAIGYAIGTLTRLADGRVLLVANPPAPGLPSSQIFDPVSGTWSLTGAPLTPREKHTVTLLGDGKVLMAGGQSSGAVLGSAELFDPTATDPATGRLGAWKSTGTLTVSRTGHSATRLQSGKVLLAGGSGEDGALRSSGEIYDPSTGIWTPTANSMSGGRSDHTATLLLPGGKVLVTGGSQGVALATSEIYDPGSNAWSPGAPMGLCPADLPQGEVCPAARQSHTSSLLSTGKVLVAGGRKGSNSLDTALLYDPAAFAPLPVVTAISASKGPTEGGTEVEITGHNFFGATGVYFGSRASKGGHTVVDDDTIVARSPGDAPGFVAVTVENSAGRSATSLPFTYHEPKGGTWSYTGRTTNENSSRVWHTASLLKDGTVLAAGGGMADVQGRFDAEIYDPVSGNWAPTPRLAADRGRQLHTATVLEDGKVLLAGGGDGVSIATDTSELYDPATKEWTFTGSMTVPRSNHTATLLIDGTVLVSGGNCTPPPPLRNNKVEDALVPDDCTTNTSEIYNPATGTWRATGSLAAARESHSATLLHNGAVLAVGGFSQHSGEEVFKSAEVYDPATGLWAQVAWMTTGRLRHSAAILEDGRVLIAGGCDSMQRSPEWLGFLCRSATASVELFDPSTGLWMEGDPLFVERWMHESVVLPGGRVLVVGGDGVVYPEVYEPEKGRWRLLQAMQDVRGSPTATVLAVGPRSTHGPNCGSVLVVGGHVSMSTELFSLEPPLCPSDPPKNPAEQIVESAGNQATDAARPLTGPCGSFPCPPLINLGPSGGAPGPKAQANKAAGVASSPKPPSETISFDPAVPKIQPPVEQKSSEGRPARPVAQTAARQVGSSDKAASLLVKLLVGLGAGGGLGVGALLAGRAALARSRKRAAQGGAASP